MNETMLVVMTIVFTIGFSAAAICDIRDMQEEQKEFEKKRIREELRKTRKKYEMKSNL